MATKTETQGSALDTAKLALAALLVTAGVIAFYWYAEQSTLYRVLGLLAVTGIAVAIAWSTAKGRSIASFLQDSRTEVRKMVWPSRAETMQTTLVVFLVVIIVGIFLWLLDMLLGWLIQLVIGV
ncbi:MAG: preprotein translocase subunit SecE [Gammaproteobacteria bacterium]|nr:preprotein translocase subunit SecE [Gammaproteobacteria bacterium]